MQLFWSDLNTVARIILLLSFASELKAQITIDSLIVQSTEYTEAHNLSAAIESLDQATELLESENSEEFAKITFWRGYAYDINGSLDTALFFYEGSRQTYASLGVQKEVARCLNYIASAYYFKGDFESAIQNYVECIDYCERNSIDDIKLQALINLGVMYRVTDKSDDAIDVYRKTLVLAQQADNVDLKGATFHNLGVAYTYVDSFNTAFRYLDSALIINEKLKDSLQLARTANAIGDAYFLQSTDLDKAKEYFLLSEQLQINKSSQDILPKTYLALGQIEEKLENYDASMRFYEKGLLIIEDTERSNIVMDYYNSYQSLLAKKGNYAASHDYLNKYIKLYKELRSIEKQKDIEELQTKYETNQKEVELRLLAAKNQAQQTRFRLLGVGSFILVSFMTLLFFLNRQLKNKNDIISEALRDKDTMLREVHHRVKNNLQLVSGLLNLQSDHIKEEKALQALRDSEIRVQSIAILHQDLYNNENLRAVNSQLYINRLVENLSSSLSNGDKNVEFNTDIEPIFLDIDSMIPIGLIVNELITNSLKHAFTHQDDGEIHIQLQEIKDTLLLSVKDNGKAMSESDLSEKSFGYNLIQNFALRMAATIDKEYVNGLRVTLRMKNYHKANNT